MVILNNPHERYKIISKLGEGGFGETYLAQDNLLESDNWCVIKKLKPDIVNSASLRLFNREAKLLAELGEHEQIPTLLDSFELNQEYYLVQEFIDGHDLRKEIKTGIIWNETELIKLLQDILEILEFVHNYNIIHRDIKPANIMRRKADGKIILIDFGGVKQVRINPDFTKLTTTAVVGTPGYMPQEQVNNEAKFCSDIYALGILAIEALTGESIDNISTDAKNFQPIWCDKAEASKKLADVIDKMVSFYFGDRYQSASEVLYALRVLSFTALDWLKRGQELYELQSYSEALVAYSEAIKINPDYFQAWKYQGHTLNKLYKYQDALTCFNHAIQIKPDDFNVWYQHGWTLGVLEKYDEALSSYEKALAIKPDDFNAWYHHAWILEILERYNQAIVSCDRAIEIKPKHHQSWFHRGFILNELKIYNEAVFSYEQAIKIKPDYFEALHGLALTQSRQGLHELAVASFKQAILIKDNDPDIWYDYGLVLFNLSKYTIALKSFKRVIEIKSDDENSLYKSGLISTELENYEEALTYFDRLIQIITEREHISRYYDARFGRNINSINSNDLRDYHDVWFHRAVLLKKMRMYDDALESFEHAIVNDADSNTRIVEEIESIFTKIRSVKSEKNLLIFAMKCFLSLMLFVSILVLLFAFMEIYSLIGTGAFISNISQSSYSTLFLIARSVGEIIGTSLLFSWRKTGFYIILFITITNFPIHLMLGTPIQSLLVLFPIALGSLIILWVLLRPHWQEFN
jgi:eukaryotic-like serine/threonine-protein kinase